MPLTRFVAHVPLVLDCPEPMRAAVQYVLEGEYESGFDGTGLDILDIGANVGAFALWARLRWPGSRIRSFEPNPGTFGFLQRNTAGLPDVTCIAAAVYPGLRPREPFFARYDGDGEGGLAAYSGDTFEADLAGGSCEVDVVEPGALGPADVVKIDIEGGEAAVLAGLDLSRTALVLAEFQNRRNRLAMQEHLAEAFEAVVDQECPWDPLLDYRGYRRHLAGDVYGLMIYARRGQTRLERRGRLAG
jgi:FkbM family methyltransferase